MISTVEEQLLHDIINMDTVHYSDFGHEHELIISSIKAFKQVHISELIPLFNDDSNAPNPLVKELSNLDWTTTVILLDKLTFKTKTQKNTNTSEFNFEVWRFTESLLKGVQGLLFIDPSQELKAKIKPGVILTILNPTIMKRKNHNFEFASTQSEHAEKPVDPLQDDCNCYPVGLFVHKDRETSVRVVGVCNDFSTCKHINPKDPDEEILAKLGKKIKNQKNVNCNEPLSAKTGDLCEYHKRKKIDAFRSARMELNSTNLFKNEEKAERYTRPVVYFVPGCAVPTTVFVDPDQHLRQLLKPQVHKRHKKVNKQIKESAVNFVLSTNPRSVNNILEQNRINNQKSLASIIAKQNKNMLPESVQRKASEAASKMKSLPKFDIGADNKIDIEFSDSESEEEKPSKKRKL
ncbi:hypothetical protein AKO1_012621 [Acrasis kona]|uniref:Uncharacterized protein n=1 Tax=Acrasis kona TaxID=1008807 RepID=A0AAW2YWP1_9EUKA